MGFDIARASPVFSSTSGYKRGHCRQLKLYLIWYTQSYCQWVLIGPFLIRDHNALVTLYYKTITFTSILHYHAASSLTVF